MPETGTMELMANDADRELEELGRALADVLVTARPKRKKSASPTTSATEVVARPIAKKKRRRVLHQPRVLPSPTSPVPRPRA